MGRHPKDRRLEIIKEHLLAQIANEQDLSRLKDLLTCYNNVTALIERAEKLKLEKRQMQLAKPQVG